MSFEVADDFTPGFQLDHIRDTKLLQQLLHQVDVIASRLAIVALEGIRPQVERIFIDQRMLSGIDPRAILLRGHTKGDDRQTKN